MSKKQPPEDEDRVTLLPVERASATWVRYPATHPRRPPPHGGMRLGQPTKTWVGQQALTGIDRQGVAAACDAVVAGKGVHRALVYLGRARLDDLEAVVEATRSDEVRERWERLWVVSPTLSRLSRQKGAVQRLVQLLCDDLGAVHLLSKFGEQNNPAVKKLFARLHDPLLTALLQALHEDGADPRRAGLLSGIVAAIESNEQVLRQLIPPKLSAGAAQMLLDMLYTRPAPTQHKRLRAAVLRERLSRYRR